MAADAEHLGLGQRHESQAQALLQQHVACAHPDLQPGERGDLRVRMPAWGEGAGGWCQRGEGGHGYTGTPSIVMELIMYVSVRVPEAGAVKGERR